MSSRQTLKDDQFRPIGYIDGAGSGKQTLRDAQFKICGYYDEHSDTTQDAQFRRVGSGNLLTTLLPPRR